MSAAPYSAIYDGVCRLTCFRFLRLDLIGDVLLTGCTESVTGVTSGSCLGALADDETRAGRAGFTALVGGLSVAGCFAFALAFSSFAFCWASIQSYAVCCWAQVWGSIVGSLGSGGMRVHLQGVHATEVFESLIRLPSRVLSRPVDPLYEVLRALLCRALCNDALHLVLLLLNLTNLAFPGVADM